MSEAFIIRTGCHSIELVALLPSFGLFLVSHEMLSVYVCLCYREWLLTMFNTCDDSSRFTDFSHAIF